MSHPLFSIVTITFNSEKTIERTLKSILNQTLKDYEYIIVDGASKDSTMDIVRKYEPLFEGRLKWKSEPDTGIYNAMNKGIMRSTGEIIGIVNSDDWLADDALHLLYQEINKAADTKEVIYTGNVCFHYLDGSSQCLKNSAQRYEKLSRIYRMGVYHPATFVSRGVYDKIGLYDEEYKLYADSDFMLRCYEKGIKIMFVDSVLSNMADGGVSNANISRKQLNDFLLKYKKRCKSRAEYYWYAYSYTFTWFIRSLLPSGLIKAYRMKNSN